MHKGRGRKINEGLTIKSINCIKPGVSCLFFLFSNWSTWEPRDRQCTAWRSLLGHERIPKEASTEQGLTAQPVSRFCTLFFHHIVDNIPK